MTPTTDPARTQVLWHRLRSAVSPDEPRLAAVLAVVAAGGLASWPIALIIHGAVLGAVAVIVLLSRPSSLAGRAVGFRWPYHTGPDTEPLADKITKLSRFADAVIAKAPRSG
jgi:hypothetical protein